MKLPELTLGVSTQRKLRLSSVLLSLLLDVLLYHLFVNTNCRSKVPVWPNSVRSPVQFLEKREFLLQCSGGICLRAPDGIRNDIRSGL